MIRNSWRLSLGIALLLGAAAGPIVRAQATAPAIAGAPAPLDAVAPRINFDIVSFKPCPPDKFGTTKVDMPMTADYLAYHCESLSRLIYFAYNGRSRSTNLDGYPKWVDDIPYEFIAKVAPGTLRPGKS